MLPRLSKAGPSLAIPSAWRCMEQPLCTGAKCRYMTRLTFTHPSDCFDQGTRCAVLQYGDIFRVSLGGQRMTYLLHPAAMKLFFSAQDDQIAFRQAPWQVSLLLPCSDTLPVLLKTELMRQQSSKRDVLCSGRPATEHFTNRVFGLPSHLFFPHHTALLHGLRAQLTPAQLPHHAHGLVLGLETHAQALLSSSNKVPLLASTGMAT